MNIVQYVGVDVAKDKFDVALEGRSHLVFTRDKKGIESFVEWLKNNTSTPWVCMESTGIYSQVLADLLVDKQIKTSIINPMQIKSFCRAKLLRNKNDTVDAKAIAQYASVMTIKEYKPRSKEQTEIKELDKLLDLLKRQKIQYENQLESTLSDSVKKKLKRALSNVKKQIKTLEEEIKQHIQNTPNLKEDFDLVTSIPGIGECSAIKLLSNIVDINDFKQAKQFAAFLGLTPKQHQSGQFLGQTKLSKIGNPQLRTVLYMASLSARRHNPCLKEFADRLQAGGKAPKAVLCAVMRKLSHLIFGVLKHRQPFKADYVRADRV